MKTLFNFITNPLHSRDTKFTKDTLDLEDTKTNLSKTLEFNRDTLKDIEFDTSYFFIPV